VTNDKTAKITKNETQTRTKLER